MARASIRESWLVFVDTNILLDFYRLPGQSADRQLKALERHKNLIIQSDQIRMEFLKNRQVVIVDGMKNLAKPSKGSVPSIINNYQPARMMNTHLDKAINSHNEVKEKVEKILKDPSHHDLVFRSLNRIFDTNSRYNLRRPDKKRYEIRSLARKRFVLGYPPRKPSDTSIGDAINWEWIVRCAQDSDEHHNILIVSRDGDYGITYNGEPVLNDWLRREFKARVSKKRKIELTNKLTIALRKMDEVVPAEDEQAEDKIISTSQEAIRKVRDQFTDAFGRHPAGELIRKLFVDPDQD